MPHGCRAATARIRAGRSPAPAILPCSNDPEDVHRRPRGPAAAMHPSPPRRAGAGGPADDPPRRTPIARWVVATVTVLAGSVLLALIAIRQPAVGTWLANVLLS